MPSQQIIEAVKLFINTFGLNATRHGIEKYQEELTDPEALKLLEFQLQRHEQSSFVYHKTEARLQAMERCVSDDIDSVFSGYELAAEAIVSLLNANTWGEISDVLKTQKEHILLEVSDVAFADLVMQPSPDKEILHILEGWNLVKMCRVLGIEEAISEYRALDIDESGEKPVRELRILPLPDDQLGVVGVEESEEVLVRPKRWLPVVCSDCLGFLYLTSVHSTEEWQQYLNNPMMQYFIQRYGFGSTRLVIEKYWDELVLPEVLEVLAYQFLPRRYQLRSPVQRVAEVRLHAIKDCIHDGVESVFSGYELAIQSVLLLLNANSWDDVREVVEANRHNLLPEVADIAFADLVMQPSSDDVQDHILGGWNLISQCRELGVEAAFERQLQKKRGIIIKPQSQVFSKLASANSLEEFQQDLHELEPFRRRQEGQAQAKMWDGFENYQAAMNALAAPEDSPKRIETCRVALGELDRTKVPLIWAVVNLDLADSLRKQLLERASPDMTEVISLYQDALTVLSPKGEPEQFGHAYHYLGDAYIFNAKGDPAENIEKAIDNYQKALGVRRPKVEAIPWATTMTHLGEALYRRLRDDRAINLDRAVDMLEQAIDVLKESDEKILLAAAYVSLGAAFTERITGSPVENLDMAVKNFNLAIETVEPSSPSHIQVWVMANGNLGSLLWKKAHFTLWNYGALLEDSETHFRLALDRVGPETSSIVHARLHMGLGLVLSDRIDAGSELHEGAIPHYEEAIRLLEEEKTTSGGDLGLAYHNLANIYIERKLGDGKANIDSAERYFRGALDAFSTDDYPVQRRDTLRAFGMMYFQEEEWEKANTRFQGAIQISEVILGGCYTEPGKESEVAKNRTLYSHAGFCLIKLNRFADALETIEQGKARMLNEAIGWKDMETSTLSTEQRQTLQWARDNIVRLEAENRVPHTYSEADRPARLGRQLTDAYRHLAKLRSEVSNETIGEIDLRTILDEIPTNGALVATVVTPKGGAAFVLPEGVDCLCEEHIVPIDSLTAVDLSELMVGSAGSGGWLNTYADWVNGEFKLADGILQKELDLLTSHIWDILMGPIHSRLIELGVAKHAPVVIIPTGWLGLINLQAAFRTIDGQRRTFGEDFIVSYSPSVRVLGICRKRLAQPQRKGKKLLAVENPTADLQFAEAECRALSDLFIRQQHSSESAVMLSRNEAIRTNVVGKLKGTNYHHFSCHGQYNWSNPAESGLKLAEGDWLHLPDILSSDVDLSSSRLVCLSACETGMSEFRDMPDEFIGLPGAFLEGGAPAVVSTLWAVNDLSTMLLMEHFYQLHLKDGLDIAVALQQAQTWLRGITAGDLVKRFADEEEALLVQTRMSIEVASEYFTHFDGLDPNHRPFAHPYYWAAFTLSGA